MMNDHASIHPAPPESFVYLPTGSTLISNPMDLKGYARCRVYVQANVAGSIDVAISGAPNEGGMYTDELSVNAVKTGINGTTSYVLNDVSRFVKVKCANLTGKWTIWVVPIW